MLMARVRTVFTGVPGTPWYSNILFDNDVAAEQAAHDAVATFWDDMSALMTSRVSYEVEGDVTIIDSSTGQPVGVVTVSPASGIGGLTTDPLPYQTQALVRLNTGEWVGGRQIVGHMYIPGLTETANNVAGVLQDTTAASIQASAETMTTEPGNPTQVVFSRKNLAAYHVQTWQVPQTWAVLRSRRD